MASKRIVSWSLGIVGSIVLGVLLATGIRSGLFFQFDQDELAHAQVSYLLTHSLVPYRQFFMTYTPVFHFLISPIFLVAGYSLTGMSAARAVMILFLLLRTVALAWIAHRVFGRRVALLSILLFLVDPFTMYSAMQIRPDNLMMLLATVGLAFLVYAFEKQKLTYFFWSGILLSASVLVLMKIAPTLAVVAIAIVWYGYKKHTWLFVKGFLLGCMFPILLFFAYTTTAGTTHEMIQEVVRDSYAINQSVAFPIPVGHFFEPGKSALFDLYGEAWTRLPYVELVMLFLAALGVLFTRLSSPRFQIVLAGSLVAQGVALALVHSVFIQYFLPITWLVNIFAAYALVRIVRGLVLWVVVIALLSLVSVDSARANILRSYAMSNQTMAWLTDVWKIVPEDASVYPNIPFRPLVYPLTFGYYFHDLPPSVTNRLPPLVETLKKNNVAYILQTYEWRALPQNFFLYVYDSFNKIRPDVFVRK